MRVFIILSAVLLIAAGCSRRSVTPLTGRDEGSRADNRYDYILSEALRQKYVGDLNEAATLFEKCIEIDSSRAVPWFELAQMYSAAGMGSKSVQYASRAARLDPGNYWYQLASGSLFTQYEMKDSAIIYFRRALKADSQAVEVNGILAGLYAEKGETTKADSLFRLIDRDGALTPDMSLMMIYGLINQNKLNEAAASTEALLGRSPEETRYRALLADIYYEEGKKEKSDSIYRQIIEGNPEDIETQLIYLMSLVNRKEYSGISVFLDNVFKSDIVERERKIAIAQRLAGDSVFVMDNTAILLDGLMVLEGRYPGDEEIMSLRPGVYEAAGMKDEAVKRLEEIVREIKPGFWFRERLLILYADLKDYRKMYDLASVYSRENNRSLLGKIYYAISAMELGEYEVADTELKKALILAGNNDEIRVQVLSMTGDLKYRTKDLDGAYAVYEEALSLSPDDPLLLNNYAYFLAEGNRDLKKALKMAEKVMETEGTNPTYMDTYAWVLYKMKKYREAHRVMNAVFEAGGERDPELLEHMGYIKKALGDCDDAIVYWKESLEKDSSKKYLEEEILKCTAR
ncbi:MAG: tetratricopeptide repeat protein [Bacteroidales bacterium]